MVNKLNNPINDLNNRSREVFRLLVESYLDTGEPMGSRTLTRSL
ncbi:MAG: heat-inducible transcriptional repressor HrcA, partial [Amylibacter sp.]